MCQRTSPDVFVHMLLPKVSLFLLLLFSYVQNNAFHLLCTTIITMSNEKLKYDNELYKK